MYLENNSTLTIAMVISFIWGVIPLIQKAALVKIPWEILFFTNTIVQFIILIMLSIFFKKQFLLKLDKTELTDVLKYSIPLTIIGIVAFSLYYYVLHKRNTFDVILITSSYFILTILLNAILFKQPLIFKQLVSMVFVFAAIVLTSN